MHSHTCKNCGHRWSHPDTMAGNVEAHTCTVCGEKQWVKDRSRPTPRSIEQVLDDIEKAGLGELGMLALGRELYARVQKPQDNYDYWLDQWGI